MRDIPNLNGESIEDRNIEYGKFKAKELMRVLCGIMGEVISGGYHAVFSHRIPIEVIVNIPEGGEVCKMVNIILKYIYF